MNDEGSEDADAEFGLVRRKVLERDDSTCQLCGFKAKKWQEVHHVNDDHSDNRKENLLTVCSYCHMCQHIGLAGRNKEAVLVWLPEIPQATLHHVVRAIQVAQRWAETASQVRSVKPDTVRAAQNISDGAGKLQAALREREDHAEARLGTTDLVEIANIMMAMPDDVYERRGEMLHGFRMLPLGVRTNENENTMEKIVDSWMEPGGPYVSLKPQTWLGIFKSALRS
ncbi:HNH endonuclease [Salipiger mucosus]|uniref:IcmJ (DotN) protein n=1 Tax=Salipiger mucosus DSM 16094 TaxID=1123237 RepID=S9QV59_9RHOB|nr:HNH endonuclease [Salipiger mucosus]EPX83493.1 IcmJ (DotN) protein [Salipiger mucosus DSM 16094]